MTARTPWQGGSRRRIAAAAALLGMLSACHSTPVAHRSGPHSAAPPVAEGPAPSAPAEEVPAPSDEMPSLEVPSDAQIALPPCLPEMPKVQPKSKPKSKPVEAAPSTPPPPAPAPSAEDAVVKPLDAPVTSVLGKKVQGPKGEDLGRVVDVLADNSGRVRVAIIEFGGFLGVGIRRIPVDWSLLRVNPNDSDKPLTLLAGRNKLQSAPEYKDATHPEALMAPKAPAAPPTPAAEGKPAAESKK